jgi:FMN phosphatase YigB (HAD superfamily)
MEPKGVGNHRVSGMLNLNLDINQEDIAEYYRKYATVKYKSMKPNEHIKQVIADAQKRGDRLVIYTDNSKENIMNNLGTLGYKESDFAAIVDMFDCNGTKKMATGRDAFKQMMKEKGIDISNAEFYDDNIKICEYMTNHFDNMKSFWVKPDELTNISVNNMDLATSNKFDALKNRMPSSEKGHAKANNIHNRTRGGR